MLKGILQYGSGPAGRVVQSGMYQRILFVTILTLGAVLLESAYSGQDIS